MSAIIERYIGELALARSRVAEESLTNPDDKTSFGFGRAVGRLEGLLLAEDVLNRVLTVKEGD